MHNVWLVYEDDYGGMFSPMVLTKVFHSEAEADEYTHHLIPGLFEVVVKMEDDDYPEFLGGLFSD